MGKDGSGHLRSPENSYEARKSDVLVPVALVRKLGLRAGCEVEGQAAASHGRTALQSVTLINGKPPETYPDTPNFSKLVSIDPEERLEIAVTQDISMRVLDLVAPIGRGQRSLIVAPPRTGKTMLLKKLAESIMKAHPEIHLIVALIDERPEEATDFRRSIPAEVVFSSNDEPVSRHVRLVELVLERARRLVESGVDVVILLDSLTRVARAYNNASKSRGRTLSGGLGAGTMMKPREFFGAARNIEHGASLTIVATALIDTGSRMDDVIFEEFKGTGNMELVLHRGLAERRVWPAIDIQKSGTRKEEKLRSQEDQAKINMLRRVLADQGAENAMTLLLSKLEKTASNEEFLAQIRSA